MKKILKILLFTFVFAIFLTGCAAGVPLLQGVNLDLGVLVQFVLELITLGALSALVMLMINIGKAVGLVKDGTADKWSMMLSLAVLVGAIVLKVFNPDLLASSIYETVNYIIYVAVVVFAFVGIQLPTAATIYEYVRGLPFIGYSYSSEKKK
jgi:hypothetical protein